MTPKIIFWYRNSLSGLTDLGPFSLNPARLVVRLTRVGLLILWRLAVGVWVGASGAPS